MLAVIYSVHYAFPLRSLLNPTLPAHLSNTVAVPALSSFFLLSPWYFNTQIV
jgi:hypothetical protein